MNPEEVNYMENVEQKLQLVQQVRSRYQENRYDLSNRERILYGRTSEDSDAAEQAYLNRKFCYYEKPYVSSDAYGDRGPGEGEFVSFFKLRMWIALFLVTAVIVMDRNGTEIAGITTEKIFQVISADYEEVIETWAATISQP